MDLRRVGYPNEDPTASSYASAVYDLENRQALTVGPVKAGSVHVPVGALPTKTKVLLRAEAPAGGPPAPPSPEGARISTLTDFFTVTVASPGASDWNAPVEVRIPVRNADVPDGQLIACFSQGAEATDWEPIPPLDAPGVLAPGHRNGFYVSEDGEGRILHILARHNGMFAGFRRTFVGDGR